MVRFQSSALAIFLILAADHAHAWRSTLYPENWQRPNETTSFYNDKLIQDFSYAGYKHGEQPLPAISGPIYNAATGYGADPTGATDSTNAIQSAINAAGNAGGGVVYLPAGTYKISPQGTNSYSLRITKSNVVLRGAGASSTFLLNTATAMTNKSVIDVTPSSVSTGTAVSITADLPGPTRRIPVASPGSFAPGDIVRLRWDVTDAWVIEHNQQTWWNATNGYPSAAEYVREVMAVNTAENWIEVDVPTRYAMKTRDNPRVEKRTGYLSGIGIESFSIGNVQHPGTTWGENDYAVAGTGGYDAHNSWLIDLSSILDSWVTGIRSYQAPGNTTTCHMLSNSISLNRCSRVTVKDCVMGRPQYGGGGGNGYMYRLQYANDCLVRSCTSDLSRHGFVVSHVGTSGNVFLQCNDRETGRALGSSSTPYTTGGSGSDNHMHFSHSNLWDSCTAYNSYFTAHHRTTSGTVPHGLTSAHGVYWNISGSGTRYNDIVRSEQARYGYVIGTSGSKFGATNTTGGNTAPADHREGIGTGTTLEPASLYLDQLARRLQPTVTYKGNGSTGGTVPVDANSPYAPNSTVTVLGAGSMVRTDYEFAGWNTAANGSGTDYAPGGTFTIDNHLTLYAKWSNGSFTVSFDGNGGSIPNPASKQIYQGSIYGTLPTTSRAGYNFKGWFTASSGGTLVTSATVMNTSANHTLYAQWTADFTTAASARHFIRGEAENTTNNPLGYYTTTLDIVGISGASGGGREDRVPVFAFPLPTLPVGNTLDSASFNFEITAASDGTGGGNLPELHAYLIDSANPSGSGTTFFYHGSLDPSTNSKRVGTTSVTITGTTETFFTAGQQTRSFTLTGNALALLKSYYDGHTPLRSTAYFRFNMSVDPLLSQIRRYRVSTAAAGSSLKVVSIAPPNIAPLWSESTLTKAAATEGLPYAATLAADAGDANSDPLSFTKVSGPAWLNVGADGSLSGTPGNSDVGLNSFTVSASDGSAPAVQATLDITVLTAFAAWANESTTFTQDVNDDGLADGLAWLLGAGNPSENASALLPQAAVESGNLTAGFKVLKAANRGSALLRLQYSKDLGVSDPWNMITVPEVGSVVGGVDFVITPNGNLNQVQATIPSTIAGPEGRIFIRLNGEIAQP
jgi:uncharacterized repeat protein (TIGR02543 family)